MCQFSRPTKPGFGMSEHRAGHPGWRVASVAPANSARIFTQVNYGLPQSCRQRYSRRPPTKRISVYFGPHRVGKTATLWSSHNRSTTTTTIETKPIILPL